MEGVPKTNRIESRDCVNSPSYSKYFFFISYMLGIILFISGCSSPTSITQTAARTKPGSVGYNMMAASNPNTPHSVLAWLAHDPNESVRWSVASNPATPAQVLEELSKDSSDTVRAMVAGNVNAPAHVLASLRQDASTPVRNAASRMDEPSAAKSERPPSPMRQPAAVTAAAAPSAASDNTIPKGTGTIEGRLVWADNTPVVNARVKLIDKLHVFDGTSQGFSVQKIAIARDAGIRETDADAKGRFRFPGIAAGKYYVLFRAPDNYEGDNWVYRYHEPAGILHLTGHMSKPDEHNVKDGQTVTVPDIELTKLLKPGVPSAAETAGVYTFEWQAAGTGNTFRLEIEHMQYGGKLLNPVYREHDLSRPVFRVPGASPLHAGRHRFKVVERTPSLRVYAKSEWIEFSVPGEIHSLGVKTNKDDPTGRTVIWSGSEQVQSVLVKCAAAGFSTRTSAPTLKLPVNKGASVRTYEFIALGKNGKELIPGWRVFYYQATTGAKKT